MTETARFWFIYSLQTRRPGSGGRVHRRGQSAEITIDDVPDTEFQGGRPVNALIRRAEFEFLTTVGTQHPTEEVTAWQLRYGGANGPVLSSFVVTMP